MQRPVDYRYSPFLVECHEACQDGCDGAGTEKCVDCIAGWKLIEDKGCIGEYQTVLKRFGN